jgi:hypothetical protein
MPARREGALSSHFLDTTLVPDQVRWPVLADRSNRGGVLRSPELLVRVGVAIPASAVLSAYRAMAAPLRKKVKLTDLPPRFPTYDPQYISFLFSNITAIDA